MKFLLSISTFYLLLFSISCSPKISVKSAEWKTWRGGQPGVGGVKYKVVLNNKAKKPFEIYSLTIDGKDYVDRTLISQGDSIVVQVVDQLVQQEPTPDNPKPQQQTLRSKGPESACISGTLNGKKVVVPIASFEKTSSVSYP